MNKDHIYDMLIIGGGPAGYTAAIYAARAGMDAVVLEKLSAGGQMALTEQIDNYPGFEEGIDGFTLGEKMQAQADRFGAQTAYAEVLALDLAAEPKKAETMKACFTAAQSSSLPAQGRRSSVLPAKTLSPAAASLTARPVTACFTKVRPSP